MLSINGSASNKNVLEQIPGVVTSPAELLPENINTEFLEQLNQNLQEALAKDPEAESIKELATGLKKTISKKDKVKLPNELELEKMLSLGKEAIIPHKEATIPNKDENIVDPQLLEQAVLTQEKINPNSNGEVVSEFKGKVIDSKYIQSRPESVKDLGIKNLNIKLDGPTRLMAQEPKLQAVQAEVKTNAPGKEDLKSIFMSRDKLIERYDNTFPPGVNVTIEAEKSNINELSTEDFINLKENLKPVQNKKQTLEQRPNFAILENTKNQNNDLLSAIDFSKSKNSNIWAEKSHELLGQVDLDKQKILKDLGQSFADTLTTNSEDLNPKINVNQNPISKTDVQNNKLAFLKNIEAQASTMSQDIERLNQIQDSIVYHTSISPKNIKFTYEDDQLGKLNFSVVKNKGQNIEISVSAFTNEGQKFLKDHSEKLVHQLKESGISVGQFKLSDAITGHSLGVTAGNLSNEERNSFHFKDQNLLERRYNNEEGGRDYREGAERRHQLWQEAKQRLSA